MTKTCLPTLISLNKWATEDKGLAERPHKLMFAALNSDMFNGRLFVY